MAERKYDFVIKEEKQSALNLRKKRFGITGLEMEEEYEEEIRIEVVGLA